jgi:DNA-binding NarL/FixJ family response regulator
VGVKRILIIIQNQLLATSIQNLLAPNEGFSIQRAYEDNLQELLAALNLHHPDILILDDSHIGREISKIFLMENNCPDVRVIVANVDDNHLKIYERFEIQLSRSADLVDAIRWDLASLVRGS